MENSMKFPQKIKVEISYLCAKSLQSLCDPMDYSTPGFSVHGILQARILEWVALPSSRDLPDQKIEPASLCRSPEMPYDPEIPLLNRYLEKTKTLNSRIYKQPQYSQQHYLQ